MCEQNLNLNMIMENDNGFGCPIYTSLNNKEVKNICNFVYKKMKYDSDKDLCYKELDLDNYFCFDLFRNVLVRSNKKKFLKFINERCNCKMFTFKGMKICVKTPLTYNSEGIFDIFTDSWTILKKCTGMLGQVGPVLSGIASGLEDKQVSLWLIDMIAIFAELLDPYAYGPKRLLLILVRLYTLVKRFNLWKEEYVSEGFMFDSLHDVAMAFAAIGLPTRLVDMMKNFTFLTGNKIVETSLFMHTYTFLVNLMYGIFEWINSLELVDLSAILELLKGFKNYGDYYLLMKKITVLYTKYVKNSQVMIDADYRRQVLEVSSSCKDATFLEYINNDSNRFFKPLFASFKDNIVRYAETFDVSSKDEPICIVFSGPPGCGKSILMNSLVSYLKKTRSVYVHTTPAVDTGKDFYDDYLNQEIFVMDDVGQQGASQWRQIINFVSPVKFPLECAAAEKKNTKFFNSNIILCTTNAFRSLRFTSTDGVSDPHALFRRVHLFEMDHERNLVYLKFNYENGINRWENRYIMPWAPFTEGLDVNVNARRNVKGDIINKVTHVVSLIKRLEQTRSLINNEVTLNDDDVTQIDRLVEDRQLYVDADNRLVMDPQSASFDGEKVQLIFDEVRESHFWDNLCHGAEIFKWIMKGLMKFILRQAEVAVCDLVLFIKGIITWDTDLIFRKGSIWIFRYLILALIHKLTSWWTVGDAESIKKVNTAAWVGLAVLEHKVQQDFFYSQGTSLKVEAIKKNMKFISIRSKFGDNEITEYCQTLVSGRRLLLPWHVVGENPVCKIYKNWDAYNRDEIECDDIKMKVVEVFPEYDTCVCELMNLVIPLYKLCKSAFGTGCLDQGDLNFVNCYHEIQLSGIGGYNINSEEIVVRNLKGSLKFLKDSGVNYNISSKGLCGSMIVSSSQGIAAMHVAGNEEKGFAIMYPKRVRDRIGELMLVNCNTGGLKFELKEIGHEFSGTRMQYEDGIEISVPIGKTSLAKTLLHKDLNEGMKELVEVLNVQNKGPPNFKSGGSPRDTLQLLSKKAFVPVGKVVDEELIYGKQVLDSLLCDFDDITLEEAVFGDDDLDKLKKDSSNGYGWKVGKEDLFDFDNKTISNEFVNVFNSFIEQSKTDSVEIKHILARETFKDELRTEKKNFVPRTFRVLPLQHIVGTKMCIGNLMKHVRKNMWKNGIAMGMNPYKDWDRLYGMLRQCSVVFDIDFGKWDGKVHPLLQDAVNEVVLNRYKGKHKELFNVILDSIVRGYVLVADKLFSTTHSLPSGTWVTTMFNSFMNKIVSAMSFYRAYKAKNGKAPSVSMFHELVDFCMGDDKLCGSPKKYEEYFNALTVQSVALDLGMECTDGNKNKIVNKGVDLNDIVFLKRNFKFHSELGKVMCPLSLDTIINTLQWYDKTKELDVVMNGKAISTQIEAYIHSSVLRDKIYKLCKDQYPLTPYFDDERIQEILLGDNGYRLVMGMLDKYVD